MHRHGYKGRKFGRERDQREALIKSLAESLILRESIETTLEKAKDLLQTLESAHKVVDEIAPRLGARTSGHLRIERTSLRRGDNAQLARVSFVDDITANAKPANKPAVKEPVVVKEAK